MSDADRRQATRTPTKFYTSISWDFGYATCVTTDLSTGGICVVRPEGAFSSGIKLFVEFELGKPDLTYECQARVVRVTDDALGIEFEDLPPSFAEKIEAFVNEHGWLF